MGVIGKLAIGIFVSTVSFIVVRAMPLAGVPLDRWAEMLGTYLGQQGWLTIDSISIGAALLFLLLFIITEAKFGFAENVERRLRGVPSWQDERKNAAVRESQMREVRARVRTHVNRIREFVLFKEWDEKSVKGIFHDISDDVNQLTIPSVEFTKLWEEFNDAIATYVDVVIKTEDHKGVRDFVRAAVRDKLDRATTDVLIYLQTD